MFKKYNITASAFILCLFGLTLITVSPVFAEDRIGENNSDPTVQSAPPMPQGTMSTPSDNQTDSTSNEPSNTTGAVCEDNEDRLRMETALQECHNNHPFDRNTMMDVCVIVSTFCATGGSGQHSQLSDEDFVVINRLCTLLIPPCARLIPPQ